MEEGQAPEYKLLESWHVYMIANKNMYQGHLLLTDKGVGFESTADLRSDAVWVTGRLTLGAWWPSHNGYAFILPFENIAKTYIEKKMMIFKNLVVEDVEGNKYVFRFGVLSPQKALDALNGMMG